LTVSKGATPVDVPDLANLTQEAAAAALQEKGLKLGDVTTTYSESAAAGQVLDWDPKSGTRKGDTVALTVSQGPEPRAIPDLTKMTYDEAAAALQALGLVVAKAERFDDDVPKNKIIGTRPAVGLQVDRGATVTVVISKGQPVVPNLNGMTEAQAKAALEANDLQLGHVFGLPGGKVFRSVPDPGSSAKRQTSVDVFVI
jgi:serine/threonine-protein kinase